VSPDGGQLQALSLSHRTSFIDTEVKSGRYGPASGVIRAGLRLLQEHEAKVKALEAALIKGEESGQPFDSEAFLARQPG